MLVARLLLYLMTTSMYPQAVVRGLISSSCREPGSVYRFPEIANEEAKPIIDLSSGAVCRSLHAKGEGSSNGK